MGSFFYTPGKATSGGGSGSGFGAYLTYASPAGASNNVTPAGFGSGTGLLDVTLTANSNWTGLIAVSDKQPVIIRNNPASGAFVLTLNNANAGSLAANRFSASGDFALVPGSAVLLLYYTTPALWIITP